jgi:polar amino acid transport system substrate-binding protein
MINDQYGHATGDRILIELSALIQKQTRKTDTFGRWGGEEFILACPHADIHEAKIKTILIQQKVQEHDFKLNKPVRCSFGITQYHKEESANDFINRADAAMYIAKQAGKDCIRTID